jgi:hypothetical protein
MGGVEQARDELYGLDPDAFMARRGELAAAAREAGDASAAKQIGALRKPTRSAYAVNLLVRAEPDAADRLAELGDQLREAQQKLDGAAIRELSTQRNKLVDELTRAALKMVGKGAPASLRDDVANTITAAIADPEVLERFRAGALVRPERWDGIGVAAAPALRLVRGATDGQPARSARGVAEPEGDGETVSARAAVDQRAQARAQARIEAAEAALAQAEEELAAAAAAHAEQRRTVRQLEDDLDEARRGLDAAEHELHRARQRAEKARAALERRTDA